MAESWIKMRGSLLTNPKVIRTARALLQDAEFQDWFGVTQRHESVTLRHDTVTERHFSVTSERDDSVTDRHDYRHAQMVSIVTRVTVGALLPLWSAVNENAANDGVLTGATLFEIDAISGVPGLGRAMLAVGWIDVLPSEEGVLFINFTEHNTVGKERSIGAKTQAERAKEYRLRKKVSPQEIESETVTNRHVTERDGKRDASRDAVTTEKSREEKKNTPLPPNGGPCRFEEFWTAWPKSERKQDKVKCAKKWKSDGLDAATDAILADIQVKRLTDKWQQGYIEAPLVYLNGKRWQDGVEPASDGFGGQGDWTRGAT